MFLYIILTILAGATGGLIFNKLKVPGGLLIGSMAGAALLNIAGGCAYMPSDSKVLIQMVAGAFIGCSMEKSDIQRLRHIIRPAAIMLFALLILNLAAGFLIFAVSPLDLTTSLMSAVPGGISDTPILAADMGADGPKVAVMQLVRQILGIGILPPLIFLWDKKFGKQEQNLSANLEKRKKSGKKPLHCVLLTLAAAAAAGCIGKLSGIPSGTFVFAIVAVLVMKLAFDLAYIPKTLKKAVQVLSGCYLGSTVSFGDILEMRCLLLPFIIVVTGYVLNCWITGKIISQTCGFTRKEGMLITTPAGASDMALISADLGVSNTDIVILQVVRAVVVMTLFPQIVNFITAVA